MKEKVHATKPFAAPRHSSLILDDSEEIELQQHINLRHRNRYTHEDDIGPDFWTHSKKMPRRSQHHSP